MKARLRDLGISIGRLPTGPYNAITDVDGVLVGHCTLIADQPRIIRTGITMILPRGDTLHQDYVFAGSFSFNGNGEMTGIAWVEESGLLTSNIAITNTHSVGVVRDSMIWHDVEKYNHGGWLLPVVGETYDGVLNDINAFRIEREYVVAAIQDAKSGPVQEGNVGGGTGMRCHQFKGGIGASSRVIEIFGARYTVGALVQANYGRRCQLRVDGVPVGEMLGPDRVPFPEAVSGDSGSIIIIIATDAPLIPSQCKRLARRATVGLARVGGVGNNSSGDLFLAFSTGNHIPADTQEPLDLKMIPQNQMDSLFEATAEAVEESILNALTSAETMTGYQGITAHELPHQALVELMGKHRRSG